MTSPTYTNPEPIFAADPDAGVSVGPEMGADLWSAFRDAKLPEGRIRVIKRLERGRIRYEVVEA